MEEFFDNLTPSYQRGSLALSTDQATLLGSIDSMQFLLDKVRIQPAKILFNDAYDGKRFTKHFTILNCGKYPAFVRIFPPTSQSFKMKPLKKGKSLPSGLSVSRTIQYTHTSAMAINQACLFIYINEKPVTYQIEVRLIAACVTISPKVLDFGEIDVGNASEQLSLQLKNIGRRLAQFSIDLGRNDLELIVEPMKGTILPEESIEVKVEVLGSQTGKFNKEFWIKTEPPRRCKLTGVFIAPKVVIEYPISNYSFILVDFPKTYYGAKNERTVVISNTSSTDRMYCLIAEHGKELVYLGESLKTNVNLKYFSFNSLEGRLLARQKSILKFTYSPLRIKAFKQKCSQIFVRVLEVNYRDGAVAERETQLKTFISSSNVEEFLASPVDIPQEFDDIELPQSNYIRLCLYGEMVEACVKFSPEDFTMKGLRVAETYDRVVNIKNCSDCLPIAFRSTVVTCVMVEPSEGFLGPGESIEVILSVKPSEKGVRIYRIVFDLLDQDSKVGTAVLPVTICASMTCNELEPKFNTGITPKITNEVGFLVDDIRFNTKIEMPRQAIVDKSHKGFNRNNTDLVAFPNDMPKCLRPWRNKVPCRTIFMNFPRIANVQDEYTLTAEELARKEHNDEFYLSYIHRSAARRTKKVDMSKIYTFQDYEVTDTSHLLVEKLHPSPEEVGGQIRRFKCIPLSPSKLLDVKIQPKYVYLGKIAPYTTCTDSFSIENKNMFSIHVSIKALSNSVVIKEKSRIVIEPKMTRNIFFDCFSRGYGKFYVPVYIIVNDNHIFDGTVFASVVPTTVKCDQKEIIINPKTHKSFFELFNPVNCDIKFSWEIQDRNFEVVPESGIIPSRKNVFCSVSFIPQINATYKTEIYLLSESGAKQIITVICKNNRANIGFSTDEVQFLNVPLNMMEARQLVLRNFSDEEIVYLVENPNPLEEVSVSPAVGNINAKSDVVFIITARFTEPGPFSCTLNFLMQDEYSYTVKIKGNVVFPTINITPVNIQIPKVPSGCYQRHNFKIKNTSAAKNVLTFLLDEIPEFTVTNRNTKPVADTITLEPNETKELILEFKPTEPVAYSLFFPYTMNHIIGPPMLNDPATLRPENYFGKFSSSALKRQDVPKEIKTLTIRCAASADWFMFSSLNLHFVNETKNKKRFTITNISNINHRFTIPFIDANHPFTMTMEEGMNYEPSEEAWEFVLRSGKTVSFKVTYIPDQYGKCITEVPLYVEKYPPRSAFNYLKLTGVHPRPVIIGNRLLYFQSITIKEKIYKKHTLEFNNHKEDCVIDVQIQHIFLSAKLLKRSDLSKQSDALHNSKVEFLIKFDPNRECLVHSYIVFSCSCGATCDLLIRVEADNCIFCSYQSFIKARAISENRRCESTFPFYPQPSNDQYYAATVKVIKEDVERWLFSQGFFYMGFFKIPYGLSRFPVEIKSRMGDNKKPTATENTQMALPLVQLLVNLVDPNVTKHFSEETTNPCFDGIDGVFYAHTVYKNILYFLEAQGVFVSQLKPEYLLPYDKYVVYRENIYTHDLANEKTFSEQEFLYFAKQAWLDLILRIYRVFVYNRATNPFEHEKKLKPQAKPLVYESELVNYFVEHREDFGDVNESEAKLMMWLQFHFDKQRRVLWDKQTNVRLENRKIRSFEKDLADSLPFSTLMVAYCPYMRKCFDNFFPLYQNEEDVYHNACIIYETWKRLHLSYDLRPIRIVRSSATEMEILVTYLYDVLPNFYPSETITFKSALDETASTKIVLRNRGDALIAYTPLFFLNDSEAFVVGADLVTIEPGEACSLTVTYKAKSILKKKAVLVLSGETIGYKFAKTMSFNLEGIPDIFHFTEEITKTVEVYKRVETLLTLTSPFEVAYEAKLYLFFGDHTKSPETLDEFVPVSVMCGQRIPRQITIKAECKFDKEGDAQMRLKLCYVASGDYTYYIYFLNKDVGDFCVKLSIKAVTPDKNSFNMDVNLPRQFSTEKCICTVRAVHAKCPRMISIDLPCKNEHLVEGLKTFFSTCGDSDEYEFWLPLLDCPKGFSILKEYLDNTFDDILVPYKPVIQRKVTYDIHTSHGKKFNMVKSVIVQDVTSSDCFRLDMHWNATAYPQNEMIYLVARHRQEVRKFNLNFIKPEQWMSNYRMND